MALDGRRRGVAKVRAGRFASCVGAWVRGASALRQAQQVQRRCELAHLASLSTRLRSASAAACFLCLLRAFAAPMLLSKSSPGPFPDASLCGAASLFGHGGRGPRSDMAAASSPASGTSRGSVRGAGGPQVAGKGGEGAPPRPNPDGNWPDGNWKKKGGTHNHKATSWADRPKRC